MAASQPSPWSEGGRGQMDDEETSAFDQDWNRDRAQPSVRLKSLELVELHDSAQASLSRAVLVKELLMQGAGVTTEPVQAAF